MAEKELTKQIVDLEERLTLLTYEHRSLLHDHLLLMSTLSQTSFAEELQRFKQSHKENIRLFVQMDLDTKTISSEFVEDQE